MSEIERDIFSAGAMPLSGEELKEKLKDSTEFVLDPQVIEDLKKMGITPEQLVEMMRSGLQDIDNYIEIHEPGSGPEPKS